VDTFRTYVRDIEKYFLNLKGEGIMLSPKEYNLIVDWRARSVPQETVYKGIRKAFSELKNTEKETKPKFRSLTQCAVYVEELFKKFKIDHEDKAPEVSAGSSDFLKDIVERLNETIKSEKRENVRKLYITSRNRMLRLPQADEDDIFIHLRKIEGDLYDDFFQSIPESARKKIMSEAKNNIIKRARFMTDKAINESLLSYRNEILIRDYCITKILDYA